MRIAFVVGSFPQLSETFILDQITGLLDLGHEIVIFGRSPENDGAPHPVVREYQLLNRARYWSRGWHTPCDVAARTARLLATQPARTMRVMARCISFIEAGEPAARAKLWSYASQVMEEPAAFDVVLAHFGTNGLIAQMLRDVGALSGPLVTVFHGHDLSKQLKKQGPRLYDRLFAHGELMLPVSEFFAQRLVALGCPAERIQVHHMGVDTSRFPLRTCGVRGDEPVQMISVCRLVEKKGIEFGMRAVAEAVQGCSIPFEWDIVGDGPLRGRLERLSAELGLSGRVRFHGAMTREHIQARLNAAQLFFAPSITSKDGDQEGIPVAIMEAAARGMPVLSTRHSGITELVHDGKNGYLADELNVSEMAQKLTTLLHEPQRWSDMGRAGRSVVERDFDLAALNLTLQTRLRSVLEV